MKMPEITLPEGVSARFGETPGEVALNLADAVAEHLGQRLEQAERASLAVSGGSTPVPFFEALSQKPLDWARVDVLLADERWVGEDDPASNTRLVRQHLLQGPAAAARYRPLKQAGATPAEGLNAVADELAGVHWPLDVLILGMGNDGHTASLFPDAPELATALDPENTNLVAAMTPPSQAQQRITLTFRALDKAGLTVLHLKGEDKLATLKHACADPAGVREMPIRAFLKPGLQVFWSP